MGERMQTTHKLPFVMVTYNSLACTGKLPGQCAFQNMHIQWKTQIITAIIGAAITTVSLIQAGPSEVVTLQTDVIISILCCGLQHMNGLHITK